jgi:DNA-directed RNA polymerase sigma subunit (sigma70/sigma32)
MPRKTLIEDIWRNDKDKPVSVDMESLWETASQLKHYNSDYLFTRGYEVLSLLYEKDGSPSNRTLKQVAQIIGVSPSRIQQNRDRAFRMLCHPKRRAMYEIKEKNEHTK